MFFGKKKNDFWELLSMASVMGIHLVSGVIVGLVMGYYLDRWLGTKPWLLIVFLVFGIIAGYRNMFREMERIQRKEKDAARR
jgi:ATP synthase protein I